MPGQAGNNHPTGIPTGVFRTKDGHINIAGVGSRSIAACARRWARRNSRPIRASPTRRGGQNRDALNALIEAVTATTNSAEWIELLNEAGVPSGPIYKMDEVFADPQVKHLRMARPVTSPKSAARWSWSARPCLCRTPWELRMATPEHGEHTDMVLAEAGLQRR